MRPLQILLALGLLLASAPWQVDAARKRDERGAGAPAERDRGLFASPSTIASARVLWL